MISRLMRFITLEQFPKPIRVVALCTLGLLILFSVGFALLWRALPAEGVKLHANIDTGVDLFGTRAEFSWLAGIAVAMIIGNMVLALRLRHAQPAAAAMFFSATIPILLGFLGVLVFIASLNFPFAS